MILTVSEAFDQRRLLVLLNIQMRENFESMKYDMVPNPTENKVYPK